MGLSRRQVLKLGLGSIIGSGLSSALFIGGCRRQAPPNAPNIVFILIDALRADHLPCYGYNVDTAPHLTALAAQSVVFRRVIAPSSWTKTSMASIMTGRIPSRHGAIGVQDILPAGITTVAKALAENGYRTIGVNTNPWLKPNFGFDAGFDIYSSITIPNNFVSASDVNNEANRLLAKNIGKRPIFMYLHYMDVHAPYWPAPQYFSKPALVVPGMGAVADKQLEKLYRKEGLDSPAIRQRVIELYDAEIRGVDSAIGQLIIEMKKNAALVNSAFMITSDHGEAFREHGTTEHGKNLYPEVYEVPLILNWPGRLPPAHINAQVCSIDIAPTLLQLAGAKASDSFEGQSLLPIESVTKERISISEVARNSYIPDLDYVAVISSRHLYVREKTTNKIEFYDLLSDPGATHNLGPAHPDIAEYAKIEQSQQGQTATKQIELDEQTREQLKSLGYLK